MTKLGVNFSIDVTKLDSSRFVEGKNGSKYVNLTCFIEPENPDPRYSQHGGIKQSTTAEERAAGTKLPYVGNVTVFWGEGLNVVKKANAAPTVEAPTTRAPLDDDIPF